MRLTLSFVILACGAIADPALAQGPSFDCTRAGNRTEHAICASVDLSQKDRVISSLYGDLRRALGPAARDRLLAEQRAWLRRRNACDGDRGCIATLSDIRIRELEARSRDAF